MQFLVLKSATEKKIIGNQYPQIQTMGGTVNRDAQDSIYNVYSNKFPDFTPNLNHFILHANARLTDALSAAMISYGFIVNEKVKAIFEQYKLPQHKFYPATVKHNEKIYNNYYWFFFISDVLDFIDYDKTSFFITDLVDNKIEDCKSIKSSMDIKKLKDALIGKGYINAEIIYLKESISISYDLFKITLGDYRTYISEKLNEDLINQKVTGFDIFPTPKISIESK